MRKSNKPLPESFTCTEPQFDDSTVKRLMTEDGSALASLVGELVTQRIDDFFKLSKATNDLWNAPNAEKWYLPADRKHATDATIAIVDELRAWLDRVRALPKAERKKQIRAFDFSGWMGKALEYWGKSARHRVASANRRASEGNELDLDAAGRISDESGDAMLAAGVKRRSHRTVDAGEASHYEMVDSDLPALPDRVLYVKWKAPKVKLEKGHTLDGYGYSVRRSGPGKPNRPTEREALGETLRAMTRERIDRAKDMAPRHVELIDLIEKQVVTTDDADLQEIARQMGKTPGAVYQELQRLRANVNGRVGE